MKYWFTPKGQAVYAGTDHAQAAREILRQPKMNPQDAFRKLLQMGYWRMITEGSQIFVNNPLQRLGDSTIRAMKDFAMEQNKDLMDDSRGPARLIWSPRNVLGKRHSNVTLEIKTKGQAKSFQVNTQPIREFYAELDPEYGENVVLQLEDALSYAEAIGILTDEIDRFDHNDDPIPSNWVTPIGVQSKLRYD